MRVRQRGVVSVLRRHPIAGYFALALILSWSWWIPVALGGETVDAGTDPTHAPGLLGPMIAAIIMTAIVGGRSGLRDLVVRMGRWRVSLRWYGVALSPLLFFLVAAVAMAAVGQGWPEWSDLGRFGGFPSGVVAVFLSLTLVNGFGEETGWRGFALPYLQRRRSLLTSSLVIAAVWMVWHTPNFFFLETYQNLSAVTLPAFFLGILAGAIFLSWLYNASGGSILIVTLWHGVYNLFSGSYAARGTPAAVVSTGVMIWGAIIALQEIRSYRSRKNLRAPSEPKHPKTLTGSPGGGGIVSRQGEPVTARGGD